MMLSVALPRHQTSAALHMLTGFCDELPSGPLERINSLSECAAARSLHLDLPRRKGVTMKIERLPSMSARRLPAILSMAVVASLLCGGDMAAQTEKVTVGITNAATDAGFFIRGQKRIFP